MENQKSTGTRPRDDGEEAALTKRSESDRRKECGDGFTYVSTVGWICRREKNRRRTNEHDSHRPPA